MIKAIVGAGGKTSLIKKMAREYREQGKKVFVCTTTNMYKESDSLVNASAEEIISQLNEQGYAMAGSDNGEKISALFDEIYEKVCAYADVVLVEADGSKHKAIKFPAEYEPVIPKNADEIIVVCGLHALGKALSEVTHRPELAKKCLAVEDDTVITAEHIQTLLKKGYTEPLREKYPEKTLKIYANHNDSLYQKALAALLETEFDVSIIREEWFRPQPRLFICGGGHVSQALVQIANCLDFSTVVIDDREEFIDKKYFPMASQLVCDSFENLENYLQPSDYNIVVTRGHKDDLTCVQQILKKDYEYLGMIGSKKKVATAFELLRQNGFDENQISKIHAPIGLNIGAVTPAEIAVSILAEIIKIKNSKHCASASKELLSVNEEGMLCVIVEKQGSSPRGVGSMMFVGKNKIIDSIGGGAVEFAAIDEARENSFVHICHYNLNKKDENALDMVCGGSNDVLFIPLR